MIPFHKVLITTAIVFCGGFALWALVQYARAGGPGRLVLALVFGAAGVALGYYLRHLKRFLGR
ncbi:MAG TPA: hypothetical protein VNI61_08630 [Gemmatimonadales bacterium]|nr:hypothetical protein [Gemmatimonadales bacterium]